MDFFIGLQRIIFKNKGRRKQFFLTAFELFCIRRCFLLSIQCPVHQANFRPDPRISSPTGHIGYRHGLRE